MEDPFALPLLLVSICEIGDGPERMHSFPMMRHLPTIKLSRRLVTDTGFSKLTNGLNEQHRFAFAEWCV